MPMPICLRLFWQRTRAAASRTFWTAGSSRPISTAMMAITTSSSTSVNAELRDGRMASPSTTDADVSPHASPLRRQADAQARGRLAVLVHEAQAALPGQTLVHDLEHHYVGAPAQADPIHRVLVQSQGTDPAVLVHLLAVEVDLGLVVAADPQPQAGPSLVS